MRIVRDFKDLNGLKNGYGLILVRQVTSYNAYNPNTDSNVYWFDSLDDEAVGDLKAMGFKFEYKPNRTFEEVMSEVEEVEFKAGTANVYLYYHHDLDKYCLAATFNIDYYGMKYYNKEQLEKAVEELNG